MTTKKTARKQPTRKQKAAAKAIIENPSISNAQALREAGYSENTIVDHKNVTESEGFLQALDDYGLTEELIVSSLAEDIKEKPKNRVQELKLGAEIRGMTGSKSATPAVAVQVNIDNVQTKVKSIFEDAE